MSAMAVKRCKHGMIESTCSICIEIARRKSAPGASIVPLARLFPDPDEEAENAKAVGKQSSVALLEIERPSHPERIEPDIDPEDEVPEEESTEDMHDPETAIEEETVEEGLIEDEPEEIEEAIVEEPENPQRKVEEKPIAIGISQKKKEKIISTVSAGKRNISERTPPPPLTEEEKLHKKELEKAALQGAVINVPISRVKTFAGQPRKFFDPKKIEMMARSIKKHGQRKVAEVKWLPDDPMYYCELIDGERRLISAEKAGRQILRCIVTYVTNKGQQYLYSVISNFCREGHTQLEIANAINYLHDEDGWSYADIADSFGQSIGWVDQHKKVALLTREVQNMMSPNPKDRDHSLKLMVAMQLINFPKDLQIALAHEVVDEEMSVLTAIQYIRRRAREEGYPSTDPDRTPRKDYQNLQGSLHVVEERLRLLLNIDSYELKNMFRNRDSVDLNQTLKKLETLSGKIENVKKNLQKI